MSARRAPRLAAALAAAALLTALAGARPAAAQTNAALAQQPFERGVALYDAGRYDDALAQFRAALALYESPNIVLYIARSLRGMGRLADATLAFERAAREAQEIAAREPRYAETRDAAREELRAIERRVARLTVVARELPADARVEVGGQAVPAVAAHELTVPVDPGLVEVVAQAPGFETERQRVNVAAGGRAAVTVALTRRTPQARAVAPQRTTTTTTTTTPPPRGGDAGAAGVRTSRGAVDPAWLALGVTSGVIGAGGFVVAGVFWSLALGQFSVVQEHCQPPPCTSQYAGTVHNGRTDTLASNIGLGVGIGATALGVVFLAIALRNAGGSGAQPRVRAAVAPGSFAIGGAF